MRTNGQVLELLTEEIHNFRRIAAVLNPSPGEIPRLSGLDIDGLSLPLRDVVGGDHLIYVDLNRRFDLEGLILKAERDGRADLAATLALNRQRAGIMLADVAGHQITDAVIAAMLHQAFLVACSYELEMFGEITTHLFERIRARFDQSSAVNKYFTILYGEIWQNGRFRFITAGHPAPYRLPADGSRLVPAALLPIVGQAPPGLLGGRGQGLHHPSPFAVHEIPPLAEGEILVLCTDGWIDHGNRTFFPGVASRTLAEARQRPASEIVEALRESLLAHAPPDDDITFVIVKRVPLSA